jgi:hypothetical protein
MSGKLTSGSRWLFLAAFIYAPWAYGCTRGWTIDVLNALLAAACSLRLLALERRLPVLPWSCVAVIGWLAAQGWFMATNAHGLYDPEFHRFIPVQSWWEQGPGAIDRVASARMMVRVSALLGALCFTIDLAREEVWRIRLSWVILAAGASVVAFGLVERILGAPMIFWEEGREARTFFATYVYHGNAGSFINLVLPVMAVLTIHSFHRPDSHLQRALCVPALLVTIAGAFVNVSKAAMLITGGLLLILLLSQFSQIARAWGEGARARVLAATGALALALAMLVSIGGWQMARDRWAQLPHLLHDNPRAAAAQITRGMTRDSGWMGFGPGTFETAFPHYSNPAGETIQGIWRYAHQDYLQTAVEWGWTGAACWAFLLFGGFVLSTYACSKRAGVFDRQTRGLYLAAALGLGATALHSMVDFPFQIASLQLYLMAYAGIGWSSLLTRREPFSRRKRLRSRTLPRSSNNNNPLHATSADD